MNLGRLLRLGFGIFIFFWILIWFSSVPAQEYTYKYQGKRDPFIPLISSSGYLVNLEPQENDALHLEGIMYDAHGESMIIVNGELLKAGESIGSAMISSIEPDRVIVIKDNEKVEIEFRREE
ncbi:MAG: hypothetical protein ABIC68_03515 [Candidatus Omnitrophota bacterium]